MATPMNTDATTTNDDEIADEDLIDPSQVIEPPPEMKTIIEKTVSFVVKNGIEFESKVRDSQRSNRKFDFLNVGHAFHNYYKQKYQIAKYPKAAALAEQYKQQKEALHSTQQQLLGLGQNGDKSNHVKQSNVISHKLTLSERIKQQLALSKVAKPEYIVERKGYNKFVVPLPTKRNISSYEISVIKLVAQFTAVHGKSFIRDLQRGEPENETFGFLSPMHPRFQYFQRLIDAYCSIIDEFEDYASNKRRNRSCIRVSRDDIWNEVIGCAEWSHLLRLKEAAYLKDEENERRANALIDWQCFTVLDTIDFDVIDDGNESHLVPPGKSIEEIEAILESTMDVEADINDVVLAHDMEEDMDISASSDDDINVIEIEMESVSKSEVERKQLAKAKATVKMKSQPMPAPKGVIVSADLDIVPTKKMETEQDIELRLKLEKILIDSRNEEFENQQCPICNEYIHISHLSQHIRIELLDPKWKEQKESLKLKLSQTTLASNQQISENLIKFNQHQNINNNNNEILICDTQETKESEAIIPPPINPYLMHPIFNGFIPPPHHPLHHHILQPPTKKMKLCMDGLIDETIFIKQNGGIKKSHKIRVKVPNDDNKKQFKFNGQTLTFTMQLNQSINQLKQRINAVLTLPTNKQKLRINNNGIWVKDANSLAFYNINHQSLLELATRTRGGKKNK